MARTKEFDPEVALDRAMNAFWELGYEKTSMQDLVDRMGVGRRSLYDTFGDKHALFMQSLRRYVDLREAAEREIAEAAHDARDAIRRLFEASLAEGSVLQKGCLATNSATEVALGDPETTREIERHFAVCQQLLTGLVRQGQREGVIAEHHSAQALGTGLFNALLGLRVQIRAGIPRVRLAPAVDEIMRILD
jgi:TetR/AcrR family transcriptional repressor of nem operon